VTTKTTWHERAAALKREIHVLYLCSRHPGTPAYVKILALCIVAYTLSPIDLIPDFVPLLGYLDDLLLVFAGMVLLTRMIPRDVVEECRQRAEENPPGLKMKSWLGAGMVVAAWATMIVILAWLLLRLAGN